MRIETYGQALDFLYSRIDYERIGHAPYTSNHYRLDRMRQLVELLGSPHERYSIVHVAGTKGKGTTSTVIYDCLRSCGRNTGLYTSPHLLRLEERLQFQGDCCSASELIELVRAIQAVTLELEANGGGRSTFFEMTTAMAFLHFANKSAEWVVLEVGLGGRLDSTNICSPVVSVITSISLDHQAQLGDTIELIAGEKAGIIKPAVPVICTARDRQARAVIDSVAESRSAPMRMLDRDFFVNWEPSSAAGVEASASATVSYTGPSASSHCNGPWSTKMLGRHQADNIAGAVATLELLQEMGWDLPVAPMRSAVACACPRARLEIVGKSPLRIVDTAHNPASIAAALAAIEEHFPDRHRTLIFASSRDKDFRNMLSQLLNSCDNLILTAYQENPRALPVDELTATANELLAAMPSHSKRPPNLFSVISPAAAWELSAKLASSEGLVLATGSFFLAAELLPLVKVANDVAS
jgi:dihydrofolate synthase / folylpolyglutamate synthase